MREPGGKVDGKTLITNVYTHVLPVSSKSRQKSGQARQYAPNAPGLLPGPGFEGEQEVPITIGR
jgi:hypothetical protein